MIHPHTCGSASRSRSLQVVLTGFKGPDQIERIVLEGHFKSVGNLKQRLRGIACCPSRSISPHVGRGSAGHARATAALTGRCGGEAAAPPGS
eukprot:scaffold207549_cov32-Tisochrysis_lutea.AAC.4